MVEHHDPVGSRLSGSSWRPSPGPYDTPLDGGHPARGGGDGPTPNSLTAGGPSPNNNGPTPNSLTEPVRGVHFSRAEYKAPTSLHRPVHHPATYRTPPEAAATPMDAHRAPSSLEAAGRSVPFGRAEAKAPALLQAPSDEAGVGGLGQGAGYHATSAYQAPNSLQESYEGGIASSMQTTLAAHRETKKSYVDRYRDIVQREPRGVQREGAPGAAGSERHRSIERALEVDSRRRSTSAGRRRYDGSRNDDQDDEVGLAADDHASTMTPLERWESRKERKMRDRGVEYVRPAHTRPSPDPRGPRAVTPTRETTRETMRVETSREVKEVARDRATRWSPREEDEDEGYDEYEEHDGLGATRRGASREPTRDRSQDRFSGRGEDRRAGRSSRRNESGAQNEGPADPSGHRLSSFYEGDDRNAGYRVGTDEVLGGAHTGSPLYDDADEEGAGNINVGDRSPLTVDHHFDDQHERSSPRRSSPQRPAVRSSPSRSSTQRSSGTRINLSRSQPGKSTYADDLKSFTESVTGGIAGRNSPSRKVPDHHSPGSSHSEPSIRSNDGREYNEMERGTNQAPEMAVPVSPHDSSYASRDHFSMNEDVRVRHRASDFCGRFTGRANGFGCNSRSASSDKSKRKYVCITAVVCIACIIATGLAIYYIGKNQEKESEGRFGVEGTSEPKKSPVPTAMPTASPSEHPTQHPTERPTDERERMISDFLFFLSNGQSERVGTAQNEAKMWILHEDELNLHLPYSSDVQGPHGYGQDTSVQGPHGTSGSRQGDWESSVAQRIKQRYALATLYYAMGIGTGGSAKGWLHGDECRFVGDYGTAWDGVGCHDDGTIRALALDAANLHGTIPHEISLLSSMENLIIKNNPGLIGAIPPNLGSHLSQLRQLGLYNNNLTGTIPKNIFRLSHLVYLNLADNAFTGTINWQEMGHHQKKLQRLILHNNQFNGSIDFHLLARATSLVLLALSNNSFEGNIGDTIELLSNLEYLYLDGNDLVGSIPDGITSLTKLKAINIDDNRLFGTLPSTMGNLTSLSYLSAKGNTISGGLPDSMQLLTGLETLNLASNVMSGSLNGLSSMRGLKNVHLYQNSFSGPIDGELFTNLPKLEVLFLSSNKLTGEIPTKISNAQRQLKGLYLSDNDLDGEIPKEVCALYKLENLYLDTNRFEGALPSCLGVISNLQRFYAFGNSLSGDVPTGLVNLPDLVELGIEDNDIRGGLDSDDTATCNRVRDKGLAIWADCDELAGGCECCERCCSDQKTDC